MLTEMQLKNTLRLVMKIFINPILQRVHCAVLNSVRIKTEQDIYPIWVAYKISYAYFQSLKTYSK